MHPPHFFWPLGEKLRFVDKRSAVVELRAFRPPMGKTARCLAVEKKLQLLCLLMVAGGGILFDKSLARIALKRGAFGQESGKDIVIEALTGDGGCQRKEPVARSRRREKEAGVGHSD